MRFLKYLISFTLLLIANIMLAQQDPNKTLFRYHMNLINPAYAGSSETTDIGINFRSQWVGVQGAPETQTVFVSKSVGRNVGLGISIINDQTFIEKQTNANIDFSYQLEINEKINLYLGIKAGLNSYNANIAGLITYGGSGGADPSISNFKGGFKPNFGAGVVLKGEKFFLSLSSPNLISTDRLEVDNGITKLGSSKAHYYLGAGYNLNITDSIIFKPSVLLRYIEFAPFSLDCVTAVSFNRRIELGASYRLNEGIGGLFIFNASHWIDLGYAYQAAFESPIQATNEGTHEVSIIFKL